MYKIAYTDDDGKIVFIEETESIKIKEEGKVIEMIIEGVTKENIGCDPNRYFIFEKDYYLTLGSFIDEEEKENEISKQNFIVPDPEKVIAIQDEYIKSLESKITNLQG